MEKFINAIFGEENTICLQGRACTGKTLFIDGIKPNLLDSGILINGEIFIKSNNVTISEKDISEMKRTPMLIIDETSYVQEKIINLKEIVQEREKNELKTIYTYQTGIGEKLIESTKIIDFDNQEVRGSINSLLCSVMTK